MNQIKLKRIGSEIAQELSVICATEAHDSLLHSITITGCNVTNDLGLAKVFFTTTLDIDKKTLEKELNDDTAGYLRTKIADRIELRHTPKIRFVFDESIEYGNNIDRIINEIHEKDTK
ncbi:MAG TPA: 30S ribosome-binding factor RbfA [Firmicutes bacterium]|nr:30S ribosome-binding factor RbfA [Bacillota bacterium]